VHTPVGHGVLATAPAPEAAHGAVMDGAALNLHERMAYLPCERPRAWFSAPLCRRRQHWYARTMVLSIICRASPRHPRRGAASIKSRNPLAVQRRNWRCTEFQAPSSSGRSSQGAPVQAIRKMASSVRRWSRGGGHAVARARLRTARRMPTLLRSAALGSPLISHLKVSVESHRTASGDPVGCFAA
jgi:hypothetical protein